MTAEFYALCLGFLSGLLVGVVLTAFVANAAANLMRGQPGE